MPQSLFPTARLALAFALGAVLTGCLGPAEETRRGRPHEQRPPIYGYAGATTRHGYVYYPHYQVYYNSDSRRHTFQEGKSWVSRRTPPQVSTTVLQASPSVRLNFLDSPASHHEAVARLYPKHWMPATHS